MMSGPVVAVSLPTYRRPEELKRAILSVERAAKGCVRLLLAVFDNDPTSPLQEELKRDVDAQVRYFGVGRNNGYVWNWTRCVRWASEQNAPYRLLLEDDNLLEEGFFDATVGALESQRHCNYAFSAAMMFDGKGLQEVWRPTRRRLQGDTSGRTTRLDDVSWAFHCGVLVSGMLLRNTSVLAGLPIWRPRAGLHADFQALCHMALEATPGAYLDRPLMRYFINPKSLSTESKSRGRTTFLRTLWILRANCEEIQRRLRPSLAEWKDAVAAVGVDRLLVTRLALSEDRDGTFSAITSLLDNEIRSRSAGLSGRFQRASAWFGDSTLPLLASSLGACEKASWWLSRVRALGSPLEEHES